MGLKDDIAGVSPTLFPPVYLTHCQQYVYMCVSVAVVVSPVEQGQGYIFLLPYANNLLYYCLFRCDKGSNG